jgi:Xaa-Pro aminopeptidase
MMMKSIRLFVFAALLLPASLLAQRVEPGEEHAQRRARFIAGLADGVLLVRGAPEPEQDYITFFQSPSFRYLTGYTEPGAALVGVKRGSDVRWMLFVQRRDPATEVWSGHRFGVEGANRLTGIPARDAGELVPTLDSLIAGGARLMVVSDQGGGEDEWSSTLDQQFVMSLLVKRQGTEVTDVTQALQRLRGTKSAAELQHIRTAAEITVRAHRELMKLTEPGMNEFELQALAEYTFRRYGAERPGFASIVGSGPNSTTLHYNANDRFIQPNETIVIDIGALYKGYSADVTRTIPSSGTFTPEQRAIYQIVRDAQAAAERQIVAGGMAQLMSDSANAVIASGLARLGLIESERATYDCRTTKQTGECPQYMLYYMHGLGHGIGLQVHDPEQYYFTGRIAVGSAFTIEPGIYVRADVLDVLPDTPRNRRMAQALRGAVQRYRNIGVRIEDDYIVTERGVEWISQAPREVDEIEALMRESWTGPAPRDRGLVERYREP